MAVSEPRQQQLARAAPRLARRARLYLVCEARPGGRDPEELLRPALQGGVDVVQLREKHADERDIVRAGPHLPAALRRLRRAVHRERPARAGDRLRRRRRARRTGRRAIRAEVRRMVGHDALIGLSTHSPSRWTRPRRSTTSASGPVHATPTKPDYEPVGLDLVRYAAEHATVPFFAIGGIDPDNVGEVVHAGAERVAVVRAIRDADDPGAAARALRAGIEAALHAGARGVGHAGPGTGQAARKRRRRGAAGRGREPRRAASPRRAAQVQGRPRPRAPGAARARASGRWRSRSPPCSRRACRVSTIVLFAAGVEVQGSRRACAGHDRLRHADGHDGGRHVARALLGGARLPDPARVPDRDLVAAADARRRACSACSSRSP